MSSSEKNSRSAVYVFLLDTPLKVSEPSFSSILDSVTSGRLMAKYTLSFRCAQTMGAKRAAIAFWLAFC